MCVLLCQVRFLYFFGWICVFVGVAALISVASAFELPNLADLGMAAVLEFADEPIQSKRSMQEGLPVVTCWRQRETSEHQEMTSSDFIMSNSPSRQPFSFQIGHVLIWLRNISATWTDLKPEAEVMMHGMGDFGDLSFFWCFCWRQITPKSPQRAA